MGSEMCIRDSPGHPSGQRLGCRRRPGHQPCDPVSQAQTVAFVMQRLIVRLIDSQNPEALQSALRWLYSFVRPHRLAIAGLLGLSVCASLLVLVQPWLTKLLIDDGLLARNFPMLVLIAGLMIVAGLLGTALSGINRYLHTRLSGRILFALRDDLYRHLQTLSPSFYGQRRIGDLMSRLDGDVAEIQRFAVDSLFAAVSSCLLYTSDAADE